MIIIEAMLPEETITITLEPHNTLRDVVKAVNVHLGNQNSRIYSTSDLPQLYKREHLDIRLDKLGFIEGGYINLLPVEEWTLNSDTNLSNIDTPVSPPAELSSQISPASVQIAEDTKQKTTPSIQWSTLPAGPLSIIFNFFTSKTLATHLSVVSTNFLTSANELEEEVKEKKYRLIQRISFMPGRNAELDSWINELKDMTDMQRMFLKTGYQKTPISYQLFLQTRGEILAGRLSLQQALEQIDILLALDEPLSRTDLLLTKKWKACLQLTQQQALQLGFTWLDLLSSWIRPAHTEILKQAIEEGSQWTVENLRGLQDYQVEGLAKGFSLENVRADWFAPIHVKKTTLVSSHRQDWDTEEFVEMTAEESKAYIMTPDKDSGQTPLYFAARLGKTTVFSDLLQEGEFTSAECRKLFTRPITWGPHEGLAPFSIAVLCGHANILITMLEEGEFTSEQLEALITKPLWIPIDYAGATPLHILALKGHRDSLIALLEADKFKPKQRRALITMPVTSGNFAGMTPFYITAFKGHIDSLIAMLEISEFTPEQSRELINEPLTSGPHEGMTPFFVAARFGHADILITMLDAGKFSLEQRRKLITEALKSGSNAGKSPLSIAARLGYKTVLTAMQNMGQYTSKELKNLINISKDQQPPKYRAYNPILWSRLSSDSDSDEKESKYKLRQ